MRRTGGTGVINNWTVKMAKYRGGGLLGHAAMNECQLVIGSENKGPQAYYVVLRYTYTSVKYASIVWIAYNSCEDM